MDQLLERMQVTKITPDGSCTHLHKYDYLRHILHLEESEDVKEEGMLRYQPDVLGKRDDVSNVEFDYKCCPVKTNLFAGYLHNYLYLRGYEHDLHADTKDLKELLIECLKTGGYISTELHLP